MEPLLDRLGRPLETLRISITDRCNFRCVYCMPKEVFGRDYQFLERSQLLTLEEIARVARVFRELGVRTVRITGGEPLVRRNVEHLVELLKQIDGLELALTTNGALLPQKAQALADAGLDRVTVSLDSVDDATFRALNDVDFSVQRVLDGIDAAAAAGLPVKVNAVVKRGVNDAAQVTALAERFRGTGHVLRFIEYMDVGHTNGWRLDDVVSADEIVETIGARWRLEPISGRKDETAVKYRYADGAGEIGVIASVTKPFCGGCSRARLSAQGELFTCLFGVKGRDLRAPLREGASDQELIALLRGVWNRRTDRYSELRTGETAALPKVEMSYIGG
ncbi:MAG TPA: GTP 3',8-cyclase MoaA [Gaiellaceae bacterium]